MKKIIIIVLLILLGYGVYYAKNPPGAKIKIGNNTFRVEIAITPAQRELGLGKRPSMENNWGMLFPYDHKEQFNYWMKDMQFPLDFVWIDGNIVADITANVPPPKPGEVPVIVKPKVPVDKVLELNAGIIAQYGIAIGDPVIFIDK